MRIAFYPQSCVPIHAGTLEERPLGGTETAIIRLAAALQRRGHDVTVFTAHKEPPPSEPRYLPIKAAAGLEPVDAFIVIREWIPLLARIPAKRRFFWTQDAPGLIHNIGIGDGRVAKRIDGLLLVSDWQQRELCGSSGFPQEKSLVLRNGVHLKHFKEPERRERKRLIYTSTPNRGLELLPQIFAALRSRHPTAELHVFSGFAGYQGSPGHDEVSSRWRGFLEEFAGMDGVHLHGNVLQEQLAREYLRSSILVYPSMFLETSCISVMEAQAAGCVSVTTACGALPESVGRSGVLLDERPGSAAYLQNFVEATDRLLGDDDYLREFAEAGKRRAAGMDWSSRALQFERYLKAEHSL